MLKLTLTPGQYLTVNGDIVVQVSDVVGNHVELAVHADRSVPIVRGEVLERNGGQRPDCLSASPPRKSQKSD